MAQNNYQVMSLGAIKYLCSVINQTVDLPSTVISDTTLATNTTFSSVHINSEMTNLENEIKRYLNTALAGLNKLTKEVINDKALVTKDNVLYLYKADDDTSNNYMQMMLINNAVIELGNTQVDMDNHYNKTEVDDKFALKIDLETLTTSFNDLKDKVDNVLVKDQLVTSITGTATDEEVPTAKAVLDYSYGVEIATTEALELYGNNPLLYPLGKYRFTDRIFTKNNIINLPEVVTAGILTIETLNPSKSLTNTYCYRLYTFNTYDGGMYIRKASTETNTDTTFARDTGWQRVCTTKVADVGKTDITSSVLNATVNSGGGVYYSVKNGICYLQIHSVNILETSSGKQILSSGSLPMIDIDLSNGHYIVASPNATNGLIVVSANGSAYYYGKGMTIFTTISYPVAES